MQLGLHLAQHNFMNVQASLQALDLRAVLPSRLLLPTKEETLVQILLQLSRLKLCLESKVAHRFLALGDTGVIAGNYAVHFFKLSFRLTSLFHEIRRLVYLENVGGPSRH